MGKSYRFFETFAVGLALACAVLASHPAYAQELSCSNLTLTEGTSGDMTCTFNNNSSFGLDINGLSPFSANPATAIPVPDASDAATLSGFSGSGSSPCTAGGSLAPGQSCGFAVGFTTDNPAGETDHDFGTQSWSVVVKYDGTSFVESTRSVTVNDPSTVPEPGSVLLLGSSLVGALGLLRRRLL